MRAKRTGTGETKPPAEGKPPPPAGVFDWRDAVLYFVFVDRFFNGDTSNDNGIGVPFDIVDHLFEPFVTTKASGKGTGLGLAVSHRLVTQHGGLLRVESEPGRWTRFRVSLPVAVPGESS